MNVRKLTVTSWDVCPKKLWDDRTLRLCQVTGKECIFEGGLFCPLDDPKSSEAIYLEITLDNLEDLDVNFKIIISKDSWGELGIRVQRPRIRICTHEETDF